MVAFYDVQLTWSTPVTGDIAQVLFAVADQGGSMSMPDIATAVGLAWIGTSSPIINDYVCDDFTLNAIKIHEFDSSGHTGGSYSQGLDIDGGEAAQAPLPPNCTFLFKKQTGASVGSRSFVGKMFVPGASETGVTAAGRIDTGLYSNLVLAGQQFLDDLDANGLDMFLRSQDFLHSSKVIGFVPSNIIGTQRRRLRA